MDWKNLAAAVLTPLVAAGLKALFALIGFEIDEAGFNTLVGAIVAALLGLFFVNTGENAVYFIRSKFM